MKRPFPYIDQRNEVLTHKTMLATGRTLQEELDLAQEQGRHMTIAEAVLKHHKVLETGAETEINCRNGTTSAVTAGQRNSVSPNSEELRRIPATISSSEI